MKLTVAIGALCALALTSTAALDLPPELKEIVEAAHHTCKDQTGVDAGILDKAMKGTFTDDPKLKCFLKCMFQELQGMREDGSLDLELIEASLPDDMKERGAMDALKKCVPPAGKELCQAAYDLIICMHEVSPELSELFE